MRRKRILLAHGEGGKLSRDLVVTVFVRAFGNQYLEGLDDGALLPKKNGRIVFTTDSYVVHPIFFPGGDIGLLSVCGTCNDLAVMGAKPEYLSCGFILEEGLEIDVLEKVVRSMAKACRICDVKFVTGDTKVVERGAADGLFINTAGMGFVPAGVSLSASRVRPGDRVLVSGTIGDHGIAVLLARQELAVRSPVRSDVAPVWLLTENILGFGRSIRFMRDPTRGGLATALCEVAMSAGVSIELDERKIPVKNSVRGVCDILGFDPLYVANEGKLIVIVSKKAADGVLEEMRAHSLGRKAAIIGEVKEGPAGRVVMNTRAGGRRLVDMLTGEQLPRIC